MAEKKLELPCPNCGKKIVYSSENPARPFCSDRCKLIDLGEWASESRRIPGDEINKDADSDESEH